MLSAIAGAFAALFVVLVAVLLMLFKAVCALLAVVFAIAVAFWPLWLVLGFFWLLFRFARSQRGKDDKGK